MKMVRYIPYCIFWESVSNCESGCACGRTANNLSYLVKKWRKLLYLFSIFHFQSIFCAYKLKYYVDVDACMRYNWPITLLNCVHSLVWVWDKPLNEFPFRSNRFWFWFYLCTQVIRICKIIAAAHGMI